MVSLAITVKSLSNRPKRILLELDAQKFERLMANFGFFNPAFIESLNRAEKDYEQGRVTKIKSLKELR